jgi:hypothetical protein
MVRQIVHWTRQSFFFSDLYIKKKTTNSKMSLCSGQIVYASLAQMSVKGAANSKLESLSVGMLDVFSSAFWTHPAYAHSVIRNCDEELTFNAKAAGVRIFQPPRSMDVIYNMFAVVDLPGLINVAEISNEQYEIVSSAQEATRYTGTLSYNENTQEYKLLGVDNNLLKAVGSDMVARCVTTGLAFKRNEGNEFDNVTEMEAWLDKYDEDLGGEIGFLMGMDGIVILDYGIPVEGESYGLRDEGGVYYGAGKTEINDPDVGYVNIGDGLWTWANGELVDTGSAALEEHSIRSAFTEHPNAGTFHGREITFVLHHLTKTEKRSIYPGQIAWQTSILGSTFVCGDEPHYVDAVGQYLIQDVEMTIGGARVGLLNSMYMYIHEELFGKPGRRQEEMIGKAGLGTYEPENNKSAGAVVLKKRSMGAQRLYVQIPFWWTGGRMERALKTIALQLHKIEFKVQTRKLEDCIAYQGQNLNGANVPKAGLVYEIVNADCRTATAYGVTDTAVNPHAAVFTTKTYVRLNEHIDPSPSKHLQGAVRAVADGGDVARSYPLNMAVAPGHDQIRAYLQIDFAGIFLNQTTRDTYLKLDEKTLFTQVLGTDTDGLSLDDSKSAPQTQTLNLSNAVYDMMVAVQSMDAGKHFGDTFGLRGTSPDSTTQLRGDALKTLSFDISSTPRTITGLSADYYRRITQFQAAEVMSELKGLYYWNVALFQELNGTRCVNSFINASKIDDLRARYTINNGAYGKTIGTGIGNTDGYVEGQRKLLDDGGCKIFFYAHVYNTIQFRNGMAGAMFA